jgi:hypothetical protein
MVSVRAYGLGEPRCPIESGRPPEVPAATVLADEDSDRAVGDEGDPIVGSGSLGTGHLPPSFERLSGSRFHRSI